MTPYLAIVRTAARPTFQAPIDLVSEAVRTSADMGLLLLFWSVIAASSHGTIDARAMVTYFLLSTGISNVTMYRQLMFSGFVRRKVQDGSLSAVLLRPVRDLPALYAEFAGTRVATFLVGLGITSVGLALTRPSVVGVLLFLPAVLAAWVIGAALSIVVAAIGIQIIQTNGLRWMLSFGIRLATGAVVPLAFYPDAVQAVLRWTPFPALVSTPILALTTPALTPALATDVALGCGWAAVIFTLAVATWRAKLRHYDAVGI